MNKFQPLILLEITVHINPPPPPSGLGRSHKWFEKRFAERNRWTIVVSLQQLCFLDRLFEPFRGLVKTGRPALTLLIKRISNTSHPELLAGGLLLVACSSGELTLDFLNYWQEVFYCSFVVQDK
ncbi:hypothetical protein J6590_039873 [Homalodisca vitripennis]|nr:hypothetical protein J6590_039873 [Homalodisca vitripennis]